MDEYHMARMTLVVEVSAGQVNCRPMLCLLNGVNVVFDSRGVMVGAAKQCTKDEWKAMVLADGAYILIICRFLKIHATMIAGSCVCYGQ